MSKRRGLYDVLVRNETVSQIGYIAQALVYGGFGAFAVIALLTFNPYGGLPWTRLSDLVLLIGWIGLLFCLGYQGLLKAARLQETRRRRRLRREMGKE
jgi:hypothetical protein